jgi:hypothetical protein
LMQVMNTAFRGTMIQRQLTPTNETYVLTLDAWAASGHANCGSRAMRLLEELEVKHQSDPIHFPPPNNRALFPTILSVVKSGEEGMVESAKELFSRILEPQRVFYESFPRIQQKMPAIEQRVYWNMSSI